jgi:hypothetical protein
VAGARIAGLLAGLCLVGLVALNAWRVPAAARPAPVVAELHGVSTGEIGVAQRRGGMTLSNRTAGPLAVRARVAGGDPGLDGAVAVTLRVAGRVAFKGSFARLRRGGPVVARLPRGGSVKLEAAAQVPAGVDPRRWTLSFEAAR